MAYKSWKPKGTNYIDSSGITHDRIALSSLITKGHTVLDGFNGRPSSLNFTKIERQYATVRRDLLTSSVTDMSDKPGDGFVTTYFWDNSGQWDTQVYISNGPGLPAFRYKNNTSSWSKWQKLGINPAMFVGGFSRHTQSLSTAWGNGVTITGLSKLINTDTDVFSIASNKITCKKAGYYLVSACATIASPTTSDTGIKLFVGSDAYETYETLPHKSWINFTVPMTPVYMAANTQVYLNYYSGGTGTFEILNEADSRIHIVYLGA